MVISGWVFRYLLQSKVTMEMCTRSFGTARKGLRDWIPIQFVRSLAIKNHPRIPICRTTQFPFEKMIAVRRVRFQRIMCERNNPIFEVELDPAVRRIRCVPIIIPVIIDHVPTVIVHIW
jgi:hypothetical protein